MSWLIDHINNLHEKPAITDKFGAFTYTDLSHQTDIYFKQIVKEIKPGQVVVLLSDYNFYAIALFCALLKHQVIIVPIASTNEGEIANRIKVANCDWLLKLTEKSLQIQQSESFSTKHALVGDLMLIQHAGLILFSSGSTGEPKAMIHDLDSLIDSFHGKKSRSLNMLVFLMFDHIGGLNTLLNALAIGAHIILPESRNAEYIAELIEKHRVNILPSTPTFLNMMLMAKVYEKFDLKSLKMITYGTETMPSSVLLKLKKEFPKTRLMQTFGTSETGIMHTTSKSSDSLEIKLDDPKTEYKIVNNELWLRSKTQVLGYLNADMSSFTADGWFQTGDLVEVLSDGYIKIIGRSKEVINVGGEKVLPCEVESVILELDIIDDCMVYSEKNAITGQMVAVQLVLHEDISEKEAKTTIRKYCRANLDGYKVPARFIFSNKTNFGDRFKKIRTR